MRKKPKKLKLEDIDSYIGDCRYCSKQVTRHQSFVAFATKELGHYDCMLKDDDLKEQALKKITQEINKEIKNEKRLS